jgi:hypothetical protein
MSEENAEYLEGQNDALTRELERAYGSALLRAAEMDALTRAVADMKIEQAMLRGAIVELLNRLVMAPMGSPFEVPGNSELS